MQTAVFLTALVQVALGQFYFSGIGKTTHTVSNATATLDFFLKHLPCRIGDFDARSCVDDRFCWCGQAGRVMLEETADSEDNSHASGFGLHTIHTNTSSLRPIGSVAVSDVEKHFHEKFLRAANSSSYDAFLDFNTGYWVGDLDPYLEEFAGMPIVALEWKDDINEKTYYSFQVQVAGTIVILEYMSAKQTKLPEARYTAPHPRFVFEQGETPESVFGDLSVLKNVSGKMRPVMHAARVSHYSSDLARDLAFYQTALGVNVVMRNTFESVGLLAIDFSGYAKQPNYVQLHLVERAPMNTTGAFRVADMENVMNSVHATTITSDICGYDQWMDTHTSLSVDRNSGVTLGTILPKVDKLGYKYHVLGAAATLTDAPESPEDMGDWVLYLPTPNGISLEMYIDRGNYTPSATPFPSFVVAGLCQIGPDTCPHQSPVQIV